MTLHNINSRLHREESRVDVNTAETKQKLHFWGRQLHSLRRSFESLKRELATNNELHSRQEIKNRDQQIALLHQIADIRRKQMESDSLVTLMSAKLDGLNKEITQLKNIRSDNKDTIASQDIFKLEEWAKNQSIFD
eukprot:CAMPEP_0113720572 /NCGR_PEP_ID=MMETSP0038_2-20120614/36558_1 /TAXON_ID=2898 /ORGANISM="Cryptomonas paramecium" /LENGTH=135 /DNA_ID=CAMNT_0000649297 /DNA_START=20 /DNA_END=424 /DNA_ORIENTATION=- /assembly_acc=CAM_ASM_000170